MATETTLQDFVRRQIFEVEAAANLFRMLRRDEGASNGRLQVLFTERQQSEKYARFLKGVSFAEVIREVNDAGSFRCALTR